jgi:hypothetical protein
LWQRKSGDWEAELASIRRETARHEKASHDYGPTGSKILELAKNAHNLFVLQDSHEQARLLKMLVSNRTFDRGCLSVSYIKPFDPLVDRNETGNWLGERDSNSSEVGDRKMVQETAAQSGLQQPAVRSMKWVADFCRVESTTWRWWTRPGSNR